jgi:hypothetical protein
MLYPGTAVWYYPAHGEFRTDHLQPLNGVVETVNDDGTANLIVVEGDGKNHKKSKVVYLEGDDATAPLPVCVWPGRELTPKGEVADG